MNRAKENEGVDTKANQLEDGNAISEIGFSSQLIFKAMIYLRLFPGQRFQLMGL